MTILVKGIPPGAKVEANAWRFNGAIVVRQLAEIYLAPVICTGETVNLDFGSVKKPDTCVAYDFYFPPDICAEHLDDEPKPLEFWTRNHQPDQYHGKPWMHFAYPHAAWENGLLRARRGEPLSLFPEIGGFEVNLGGFAYVDGPLPAGPRRKRAPRIPEVSP